LFYQSRLEEQQQQHQQQHQRHHSLRPQSVVEVLSALDVVEVLVAGRGDEGWR
jgi:hypothetical protein